MIDDLPPTLYGTIRASAPFVDRPASTCLSTDPRPGPSFAGEHRPLTGVGALWDCVPRVCGGGGGCAGGGVPLGAVPVLSWCGEVFLRGIQSSL